MRDEWASTGRSGTVPGASRGAGPPHRSPLVEPVCAEGCWVVTLRDGDSATTPPVADVEPWAQLWEWPFAVV